MKVNFLCIIKEARALREINNRYAKVSYDYTLCYYQLLCESQTYNSYPIVRSKNVVVA